MELTVIVVLLEVHVDDTTGPDVGHLGTVQGLDLGELAGLDGVAAVLGEENGNVVVLELLGADVEAGLLEAGVTAPRVDVVTPEVDALVLVLAVEVVGHVVTDVRVIAGGVTNTHGAVVLGLDVGLHVTDSGLDVGAGVRGLFAVGDLVTGEETDDVLVLGQLIHDGGVTLVEVVVPLGVLAVDGLAGRGQIRNDVDAGLGQEIHALLVVLLRVDGVHTDGVGTEFLKHGDITLAGLGVGQRILVIVRLGAVALLCSKSVSNSRKDMVHQSYPDRQHHGCSCG